MSENKQIAKEYIGEIFPIIRSRIMFISAILVLSFFISFTYIIILLLIYTLVKVLRTQQTKKEKAISYFKTAGTLILFLAAIRFLGAWGAGAVLIGISAYFIWKGWPIIRKGLKTGERMVFGKTLDKENWVDTRPKLNMQWKKKKQQNK